MRETYPRGNGYSYSYDSSGNLIEKRQKTDTSAPNSNADRVTSYEYGTSFSTPTRITLPNGLSTTYDINNFGQIIHSQTSGIELGNGSQSISHYYSYDALGNLISQSDANGNITSYTYDGNLLLTESRAGDLMQSYSYNAL